MTKELFYEDVEIGTEIPPLVKQPTTQQLVKWAGASGDFYQIHYDKDYALGNGLPDVLIHGPLKSVWLGQLLSDWIGENGTIRKYSCSHRGMDVPRGTITCKGTVVRKYVNGDEHYVECEIWVENSGGERTAPGTALVALPSKS